MSLAEISAQPETLVFCKFASQMFASKVRNRAERPMTSGRQTEKEKQQQQPNKNKNTFIEDLIRMS